MDNDNNEIKKTEDPPQESPEDPELRQNGVDVPIPIAPPSDLKMKRILSEHERCPLHSQSLSQIRKRHIIKPNDGSLP